MIAVQDVSKFLDKKELLKGVSFHVRPGERIGLIGTNGAGKTTLFHIILGEVDPDTGGVAKAKHLTIGYLPQQCSPPEERTILGHIMAMDHRVVAIRSELEQLRQEMEGVVDKLRMETLALRQGHLLEQMEHCGGYDLKPRAEKILTGLGFRENQFNSSVTSLSGGWLMRLELARLLLAEPDLLLLDEPTNHLDLDSLLWLEQYLLSTPSAMVVIAHDRTFLNRVVTGILELEGGQLYEYSGNYDFYLKEKTLRREILVASHKNQQERIRQVERFIERNRCRKDRARQVQSRLKSLDKIQRIELIPEAAHIHFDFPDPPRSGKRVIELRELRKAYGAYEVYAGADLIVEKGDRIAFLGKNGAGKSTLLKILAGVEPITGGERLLGHNTTLGYYAQYQWEQLASNRTVLEEAASIAGDLSQSTLRGLLGAFLFQGESVEKKIAVLSGGEKARLILCKLLLQRPNLLLMDEPTNHLDIPSRNVLEQALGKFPGTLCFISHDRHFINALANKVLLVENGRILLFPGNYDDYLNIWKKRLDEEQNNSARSPEARNPAADSTARRTQEQKRLEAQWRNQLYQQKKPLQAKLTELDASLHELHLLLDSLNRRLGDPKTYSDGARVQQLQKEHQNCRAKIAEFTAQWELNALALEELEENFWKDKQAVGGPSGG